MEASKPVAKKLFDRLKTAVDEQKFYEAHQIYKTIYFRYVSKGNYADSAKHLFTGSKYFLENKQYESGFDLAKLLIKTYKDGNLEFSEEIIHEVRQLYKLLPIASKERAEFSYMISNLLKSKGKASNDLQYFYSFCKAIGRILWQETNFEGARYHLMRSDDGFSTGCMLVDFHLKSGFRTEVDLFIVQAVLQYLCMRKLTIAALAFHTYTRRHPNLEPGPPYTSYPLLNFIWFLMLAVEQKSSSSVFKVLVGKYSASLKRDPEYNNYVDMIGQIYFEMPKKEKSSNDLMSNIFKFLNDTSVGDMDDGMMDFSDSAIQHEEMD